MSSIAAEGGFISGGYQLACLLAAADRAWECDYSAAMKTLTETSYCFLLNLAILCLFLASCKGQDVPHHAMPPAPVADSPAARGAVAQEIIRTFPTSSFMADLNQRIEGMVGSQVGSSVQERLRNKVGVAKIEEIRLQQFVDTFTVAELQELLRLYQSPAGTSLVRKLPAYDAAWRDYLGPIVAEVLSGSAEQPVAGE